ncbi:MAG: putative Na+/H+ antiporter [Vicinamibacterales bacterium]
MIEPLSAAADFPRALDSYPVVPGQSLFAGLAARIQLEPFNAVATAIFVLAIVHTFAASRFTTLAHRLQHEHDARARLHGMEPRPRLAAEVVHFFGEVEVVFGLWAVVLLVAISGSAGWETAVHYINYSVNYTEALFVVVIMALASSRPVISFAEAAMRRVSNTGGSTPAAWWATILTVGPLLGSFITEPAAMTISALLLARQFYDLGPSLRLRYATLGLLFVNVSIGGTLTHFAAPPVLMVSRPWGWGTGYMLSHFGWRAVLAILISTALYLWFFRREFHALSQQPPVPDVEQPDDESETPPLRPVPGWITGVHLGFIAWTVFTAHYPVLFVGGFLFFLGFSRATAECQSRLELRTPLLVGFFLAGLVIHGGLQGWWISPVLSSLAELPLFAGATLLTAINDNALITYLATLVPDLAEPMRRAVVQGAVVGGGLTVIANAPNPAGQAILARFFPDAISPLGLAAGAAVPTLIAAIMFRLV